MGVKFNIWTGLLQFYPSGADAHIANTNWDAHGAKASQRDTYIRATRKLFFDG